MTEAAFHGCSGSGSQAGWRVGVPRAGVARTTRSLRLATIHAVTLAIAGDFRALHESYTRGT